MYSNTQKYYFIASYRDAMPKKNVRTYNKTLQSVLKSKIDQEQNEFIEDFKTN